jgi:hypothetical protein
MPLRFPSFLSLIILPVIMLLVSSRAIRANMADPLERGALVGEPSPMLDSIGIEHEELTIDLRPLAAKGPARIEAVYRIRNDGAERRLDLLFVASALTADSTNRFEVLLDNRPVKAMVRDSSSLPERWQSPKSTPAFDGENNYNDQGVAEGLRYETYRDDSSTISFTLLCPPGLHTIRVAYHAMPTSNSHHPPVREWQLGYVLAPARRWREFGGLNAKVILPEGWEGRTAPEMSRIEDTLVGRWDDLPADAISITARKQPPSYLWLANPLPSILAVALAITCCITVGRMTGRGIRRRGGSPYWIAPVALLMGILSVILLGIANPIEKELVRTLLDDQIIRGYGYGAGIALLVIYMPLAFIAGSIVTAVAANRMRRRRE